MIGSIIKNTIQLDKEAREKIAELKKEKENLDKKLKSESIELQKSYEKENLKIVEDRKIAYQDEIKARQEKEKATYNQTLTSIQKQYKQNRDKWVKEIYQACIES